MAEDMNAFLFLWNEKYYSYDKILPQILEAKTTGKTTDHWSIANHTKVRIGDRAFITKVGDGIKGIFASGTIISNAEPFPNRDGKIVPGVNIEFDTFLDPKAGQILEIGYIKEHIKTNITKEPNPRQSGMIIKPVSELEKLWSEYLVKENLLINRDIDENIIIEGTSYQLIQTLYERNRQARELCLEHHGYSCVVCGFNFKNIYGDIGDGYIHVHHLNQLSITGQHETNPINDLRPVCPNCHSMLHKRNPPFTIEELKNRLNH